MWLKAPKNMPSVSVGGIEYKVDKSGLVEVPDEAGKELLGHGLTAASAPDAKGVKEKVSGEQETTDKDKV